MNKEDLIRHILNWYPKVLKNGDVTVRLVEKKFDKIGIIQEDEYTFKFTSAQIIEFIRNNCQRNVFYQINLEGKLDRLCGEYQDIITRTLKRIDSTVITSGPHHNELNLTSADNSDKTISELAQTIALYRALLEVFRGSPSYDSPYGGGTGSVFNFHDFIRPTGSCIGGFDT